MTACGRTIRSAIRLQSGTCRCDTEALKGETKCKWQICSRPDDDRLRCLMRHLICSECVFVWVVIHAAFFSKKCVSSTLHKSNSYRLRVFFFFFARHHPGGLFIFPQRWKCNQAARSENSKTSNFFFFFKLPWLQADRRDTAERSRLD